jgi:hypothetical protein
MKDSNYGARISCMGEFVFIVAVFAVTFAMTELGVRRLRLRRAPVAKGRIRGTSAASEIYPPLCT